MILVTKKDRLVIEYEGTGHDTQIISVRKFQGDRTNLMKEVDQERTLDLFLPEVLKDQRENNEPGQAK